MLKIGGGVCPHTAQCSAVRLGVLSEEDLLEDFLIQAILKGRYPTGSCATLELGSDKECKNSRS